MNSHQYFTPGKLYITGEYFVVNGDTDALIVPVQKGITVTIKQSDTYQIYIDKYQKTYSYKPRDDQQQLPNETVQSTLQTIYQFFDELSILYHPVKITVHSTMDSPQGLSYGFGSNGAVIIALIKSLSDYHNVSLTSLDMYKIGVISQKYHIDQSSFGDLATSAFESSIMYHVFSKTWFNKQDTSNIVKLCQKEWKELKISKTNIDLSQTLVVNTGIKANSFSMVNRFKKVQESNLYQLYVEKIQTLQTEFIDSLNYSIIKKINKIYQEIDDSYGIGIFIKQFEMIEQIAQSHNGISTFSGAGGGDNIIIFFSSEIDRLACYKKLITHKHNVFKNILSL